MTFARRPIEVVEIVQPLCSRVFGTSPCLAVGIKCYNTDFTCKFREALDLTDSMSLKFVRADANAWILPASEALAAENGDQITTEGGDPFVAEYIDPYQPALAIPALVSYSTAPTSLNVSGGSRDKSPLGYRAVANIRIKDFPWNDVDTDPYRTSRTYDPIERGSFWTKWLARNPFHVGYTIRIYEGVEGDALVDMIKREYVIEKIDHGRDGVNITAKDILSQVTEGGQTAPQLSTGSLSLDLTDVAASFTVVGAVLADYPATGWVRIGDELLAYTGRALSGLDIDFTGVTRGQLGSTAASHSQFDTVQRVIAYENEPFTDIIYDLLVTWGGIDAAFITLADWTSEFNVWRPTFSFTAYLTAPEEIDKLVGEICLQAQVNIWWDERVQKILLKSQRPDFEGSTLTANANILAGSYSMKEKPQERVSQVWVYYGLRNWADSARDKTKYARGAVFIDVNKQIQYGGKPAVREITARWIPTQLIANNLALAYLERFKDVRREITFELGAQDGNTYWTGDSLNVDHFLDVNIHGAAKVSNWLITSAEAVMPNGRYRFVAEDNGTAGFLWEWVDGATTPAFADATETDKQTIGYWLDDSGNDADGAPRPFRWL